VSNPIRWFITYEAVVGINNDKARIANFLQSYKLYHKSSSVNELLEVFDQQLSQDLQFELVVFMDIGSILCPACYLLEQEDFIIFFAAEILDYVMMALQQSHTWFENTRAFIEGLDDGTKKIYSILFI
jgi:hypothetical protein